MLISMIL